MKIIHFKISGLFDLFDQDFSLNGEDNVTILYAPNGYGKTAILRLIDSVTSARLEAFRTTPFINLTLKSWRAGRF